MKAIALLWDNLVAISAGDETRSGTIAAGQTAAAAIVRLAEQLPAKPTHLRLIYQPRDLISQTVECPNGSRRAIQSGLANEHPEVEGDMVAWSCQPLTPTAKEATTVLNTEKVPRLHQLIAELAAAGLLIDAAYPLLSLLEQLPAFIAPGPAFAIAHTEHTAILYARDDANQRNTITFTGEHAESKALEYFGSQITAAHQPPNVSLLHTTPAPWPFQSYLHGTEATAAPLFDSLGIAAKIPANDLSNFIPVSKLPSPDTFAIAASVLIILASLAFIGRHELSQADQRSVSTKKQVTLTTLQGDVAVHQKNKEIIDRANSLAEQIGPTRGAVGTLVRYCDEHLPREITLTSIKVDGANFTIDGIAHVGRGEKQGPFYTFFDGLNADARPWKLTAQRPETLMAAEFTITGTFK